MIHLPQFLPSIQMYNLETMVFKNSFQSNGYIVDNVGTDIGVGERGYYYFRTEELFSFDITTVGRIESWIASILLLWDGYRVG